MHRKLAENEKAQAAEVDRGVKNKWNFRWLAEKIKVTVILTDKKEKHVELCVGDSICKVATAGEAIYNKGIYELMYFGGMGMFGGISNVY